MTEPQHLVASFDALPLQAQREVAAEILRRTQRWDAEPLSDKELNLLADDLFTELDREEAEEATDGE